MYFRVRRDHPENPLARYSTHVAAWNRAGALRRLLGFYRKHYGFDAWMGVFTLGVVLLIVALVMGTVW